MNTSSRGCLILLVAATAWLPTENSQAEYEPPFDLDGCVAGAQLIVAGQIHRDGQLRIDQVLEGAVAHARTIGLRRSDLIYRLGSLFDKQVAIDVIAFLKKDRDGQWALVSGLESLVVIEKKKAFPYGVPFLDPDEPLELKEAFRSMVVDQDKFVAAIHQAAIVVSKVNQLLEQPRSIEGSRKLIDLAGESDQLPRPSFAVDPFRAPYCLRKVAEALRNPSDEEELDLMQALQRAQNPQKQRKFLEVAGSIPVRDQSFDVVAGYITPDHTPEVRRAAMKTVQCINRFRAVEVISPLLTRNEPELETALQSLGGGSIPSSDPVLNLKAVAALEKLAKEFEEKDKQAEPAFSDDVSTNQAGAFVMQLAHYGHPRLLPILLEWALKPDHPSAGQAWANLCAITGLKIPREDQTAWKQWWAKAKPVLEPHYELKTKEGISSWMKAWTASDDASRKILMNLWPFEPDVDEGALLAVAKTSEAARAALSELWRLDRLSPNSKRSIVQDLLSLKVRGGEIINGRVQIHADGETEFRFPQNSEIEYRGGDLSGRHPGTQIDQEPWGVRALNGDLSRFIGLEEDLPGSGMVHAALDIREVNHRPERKVLWSVRKEIGPVRLDTLSH